jgi:hypothetical protein
LEFGEAGVTDLALTFGGPNAEAEIEALGLTKTNRPAGPASSGFGSA